MSGSWSGKGSSWTIDVKVEGGEMSGRAMCVDTPYKFRADKDKPSDVWMSRIGIVNRSDSNAQLPTSIEVSIAFPSLTIKGNAASSGNAGCGRETITLSPAK
jgi:hypothetical protein